MTTDEIKQRAKNYAETSIRILEEVKAHNYNNQWSDQFSRLVREQKEAVKRTLNWVRLDPDFIFNSPNELLTPHYRQGTEEIGNAINGEVNAVFEAYEKTKAS